MNLMDSILPHKHKHYFVTVKKEFEPIEMLDAMNIDSDQDLYVMREYAYLMCNSPCNDVKKVIVRKEVKADEH